MKAKLTHYLLAALLGVALTTTLHAQLVADGSTLNFTGATNLAGNLIVGTNGGNTLLNIQAPGTVTNVNGTIGLNPTSTNNVVRVQNSGAVWRSTGDLNVGDQGANNSVVVTNGGTLLVAGYSSVGNNPTASNNLAVVSGSNSVWTINIDLTVGTASSGNQLVVSNGGRVADLGSTVGDTGTHNMAEVTGPGSLWTNSVAITVGNNAGANQLVVSNGGVVANTYGVIGNEVEATNNLVVVTGTGSRWNNSEVLTVGYNGSGNQLVVTNGGTVQAPSAYLSFEASSLNNRVIVDGGNLITTNSGGTGTLDIRRGTNVLNAGLIQTDSLLLNVSAGRFEFNGGTLITGGGTVDNGQVFVVGASGTTAASLDVRSNAPLVVNSFFTLGANTAPAGNQLLLTNGGTLNVTGGDSLVGQTSTASNNVAVVAGPGSLWANSANLFVGNSGSGNRLVSSNGGVVANFTGALGFNSSSSNNVAVVTGSGSLWTNRADFIVGFFGGGNQLVVTNGGTVHAPNAYVGYDTSSTNNRVTVSGGNLIITNLGGTGTLDFRRGTNVLNAGLIRTDKLLFNSSAGFFNFNGGTLITRSGTVSNGQPFVVGASGATAAILDLRSNAQMTLNDGFTLGANAKAGNQLLLTNGGVLTVTGTSIIGATSTTSSNLAVISGPNSLWTNSGNLYVGNSGIGNQLVVSNGGTVANAVCWIGVNPGANNNMATVTGTASRWNINGEVDVGREGSGSRLVVSNGGVVTNAGNSYVGLFGSSNVAVVTGTGSLWFTPTLYVGYHGNGNQLVVSNGGTVQAAFAVVGNIASSTNNRVIVDGGNLIVTNSSGTAVLDIRRGTNVLNAGLIRTDSLLLNNSAGFFEFNGGALSTRGATVNNGSPLVVGNGSSAATYRLVDNGLHAFNDGLVISTAATLTGNGTVAGPLSVQSGGEIDFLGAGGSMQRLTLNNSPSLAGTIRMRLQPAGVTNDSISVQAAGLTYGGSLELIQQIGAPPVNGNSFKLFSATSYGGAFVSISLPPLSAGLVWTNRLLLDGSIAVVPISAPTISGLTQSGTNLVFAISGGSPNNAYYLLSSTNVATPLMNWSFVNSGHFDWLGNAVITNGINLAEPERYFRVQAFNSLNP